MGGAKNSYHLQGQAADIHCADESEAKALALALLDQPLTDLALIEIRKKKCWVHVQWSYAARHRWAIDRK